MQRRKRKRGEEETESLLAKYLSKDHNFLPSSQELFQRHMNFNSGPGFVPLLSFGQFKIPEILMSYVFSQ